MVISELEFVLLKRSNATGEPSDDHLISSPDRQLSGGERLLASQHELERVNGFLVPTHRVDGVETSEPVLKPNTRSPQLLIGVFKR
jgi:hypothetical protein